MSKISRAERNRKLEELYNTDPEGYVRMLTADWSQYDWDVFNKAIREPIWDEINNVELPSYYDKYIKNA